VVPAKLGQVGQDGAGQAAQVGRGGGEAGAVARQDDEGGGQGQNEEGDQGGG